MNTTYVIGDTHGNLGPYYDWIERVNSGDTLISVGDFGMGFIPHDPLLLLGKSSEKYNVNIKVIRGNHDDPKYFDGTKIGNVEFVKDYSQQNINGKNILFIGGAISVDRCIRTVDFNYWKDESVIYDLSLLDKFKDIDILITHTCPDFLTPVPSDFSNIKYWTDKDNSLYPELVKERKYMSEVWENLKENNNIQKYYYGHFHVSASEYIDSVKFRCLNIDEILEL